MSKVDALFTVKAPEPLHVLPAGNLQVAVYDSPREMGLASALAIAAEQCRLVAENGETSLQLMAAPSAFPFYEAYIRLAQVSVELQQAIGQTHYLQFDDYLLRASPGVLASCSPHNLYGPLSEWYDPARFTSSSPMSWGRRRPARPTPTCCRAGARPDAQGQGEDGHWGFHQPGIPIDGEPAFITVR